MSRQIEFGINSLEYIGSGKMRIGGVVHAGPLRVGHIFTRVKLREPLGQEPVELSLQVEEIWLFQTKVDEVAESFSAGLVAATGEESKLTLGAVLLGDVRLPAESLDT